jgi:membrane protease YdiL (CAAX protease family)
MRTDIKAVAIAMTGYLIITSVARIVMLFFAGAMMNGIVYVASSFVGLGFIWLCFKSDFYLGDILYEQREIPPKVLRNAIICIIGIQPVFQLAAKGIETGFYQAGYQIKFESFDPFNGGLPFILLNTVLLAPLIEEVLFRGVILRILSRYGRNFAIVTSAILFGLYHTDLIEFFHGFICGLLLAYITFRYSIKWAAVLHCISNLVISAVALVDIPWYFSCGFLGIFFVGGVIVAVLKLSKVRRFAKKGRSVKNAYPYFFTAPAVIIYIIIALLLTFLQTSVIPLDQLKPAHSPLTIALD